MARSLCGCVCWSGLFLASYQGGAVRCSARNLDHVNARCGEPP